MLQTFDKNYCIFYIVLYIFDSVTILAIANTAVNYLCHLHYNLNTFRLNYEACFYIPNDFYST
jgi:hypothetical protein